MNLKQCCLSHAFPWAWPADDDCEAVEKMPSHRGCRPVPGCKAWRVERGWDFNPDSSPLEFTSAAWYTRDLITTSFQQLPASPSAHLVAMLVPSAAPRCLGAFCIGSSLSLKHSFFSDQGN